MPEKRKMDLLEALRKLKKRQVAAPLEDPKPSEKPKKPKISDTPTCMCKRKSHIRGC